MNTPIYVKMDAHDDLLLSEGVCRHLGIIVYHPRVKSQGNNHIEEVQHSSAQSVRISLVDSVRLEPRKETLVTVKVDSKELGGPLLLEPSHHLLECYNGGLTVGESLVQLSSEGHAKVRLTNTLGSACKLDKGEWLGLAFEAELIAVNDINKDTSESVEQDTNKEVQHEDGKQKQATVQTVVTDGEEIRKRKLVDSVAEMATRLPWQEKSKLQDLLCEHHNVFALEDGERGEKGMVQMTIDTGDYEPKRQPARRTPFAARKEIAHQLRSMQDQGVIRPSSSPWASPVVLVRKKDGSLRFCIDYRNLNSVTKGDTFPLPRIDDMLDQVGKSKFFSTLDLAAGYWQVQVHPDSCEKTAFITHQGLYEFSVMPFGLKNAPAVFQRLMQRVLMGLNPDKGPSFVSVYLDDVIVFSETLEDHLEHLRKVMKRFVKAGLKLKPSKCHFVCERVEYLGHIITPQRTKPNSDRVAAVQGYPVPASVKKVKKFIGLVSYYRKFIKGFAKIAEPLHLLTRKDVTFEWSSSCQDAFDTLKRALIEAPVLAYPNFSRNFRLETDACVKGLGAVLAQMQKDGQAHPVAYASRALSDVEKRYAVTELETLAVVWALNHFHVYLYGNEVAVYTDHSAVKAVLETPNPSAKHARWWTKVYGSGVKNIQIVYRSGRENSNADALSRNPQAAAPVAPPVEEVQIATVHVNSGEEEITGLLNKSGELYSKQEDFGAQQQKDKELKEMIQFLMDGSLPDDNKVARKVAIQATCFTIIDGVLYFVDNKCNNRK